MTNTFTLLGYTRPTKIEWLFSGPENNWIENITSKSTQKIARSLGEIIEKSQLQTSISLVTTDTFLSWLGYYTEKMTEQGHDIIATPEWLQTKQNAGFEVYNILFHQAGKLVGSSIFSKTPAGKYTEHFKASDRIIISNLKNASLGTLIDLFFIKTAVEANATSISSGVSRNGFGYYNNLGYLAFKIKLGYTPFISESATFDEHFEYTPEQPCIWFVSPDQNLLEAVTVHQEAISSEIMGLLEQLGLPIKTR